MKKTLFLVSHLCSDASSLIESLSENSKIHFFENDSYYMHYSDLENLHTQQHKLDNTSAIYCQHFVYNTSIYWGGAYDLCKFLYIINDASVVPRIAALPNWNPQTAFDYYCFRLQRIYRMIKQSKDFLFVNNNINENKICEYLKINKIPEIQHKSHKEVPVPNFLKEQAQDCYEKYLFKINQVMS